MNQSLALDDLSVPLRALRLLAADLGHLPAPEVHVSVIFPDRLTLRFHDDVAAFESWREALNIAPEGIGHRVHRDGLSGSLSVEHPCAGARLELIAYVTIPVPEPVAAVAGVVS
ncbi:hypothetical protein [Streptomyces sp. ODS05-4]|uniref:hypothetical protein n=1 Tax=Streptomyces sp. ODS05-4 TaxID=2944939 RepID=UPI00210C7692|nr:hypothetical protein [Streptomyces sp. ODS05-4]